MKPLLLQVRRENGPVEAGCEVLRTLVQEVRFKQHLLQRLERWHAGVVRVKHAALQGLGLLLGALGLDLVEQRGWLLVLRDLAHSAQDVGLCLAHRGG